MNERLVEGKSRLWSGAKLSVGAAVAALAVACGSGQTSEVRSTPTPASIDNDVDVFANTGDNDPCNTKVGE